MAKKNTGGRDLDALTLRQIENLSKRLGKGARALPHDHGGEGDLTAIEIFDVNHDLHNLWMDKFRKANPS